MNKKIALLFSSLLMTAYVAVQAQSSTPSATTDAASITASTPAPIEMAAPAAAASAACEAKEKGACPSESASCGATSLKKCCAPLKKGCHDVLTPEERHHFCEVKCRVLEANPSLKDKKKKRVLCDAILKEDPSLKPVLEKLKKHCQEERQKKKAEQSAVVTK